MTQKDKIQTILKELYKYKYDEEYYSLYEADETLSPQEAHQIGIKLEREGLIEYIGQIDTSPQARITANGVGYIEPLIEYEQEHSIVINQAWEDYGKLAKGGNFARDSYKFADELQSLLWQFDLEGDQLIYLKQLKKILSIGIEEHKKKCHKIGDCPTEDAFAKALFTVKRKIQNISENSIPINNFTFTPPDPLDREEIDNINSKLDDILDKLTKVEFGQQVIYDNITEEFEDIRKLLPLIGKKNAMDLIKGKLIDLGLSKILSMEVLREVFKILTGTPLSLT